MSEANNPYGDVRLRGDPVQLRELIVKRYLGKLGRLPTDRELVNEENAYTDAYTQAFVSGLLGRQNIFLGHSKELMKSSMEKELPAVLSHESEHLAMHKLGEAKASTKLDRLMVLYSGKVGKHGLPISLERSLDRRVS